MMSESKGFIVSLRLKLLVFKGTGLPSSGLP
jgi:hypothetical protein